MEERGRKARDEAISELIANLVVALLCGLVGAAVAVFMLWRSARVAGAVGTIVAALLGGVVGSAYGLWHAISGWRRNDAQLTHDDEFGIR